MKLSLTHSAIWRHMTVSFKKTKKRKINVEEKFAKFRRCSLKLPWLYLRLANADKKDQVGEFPGFSLHKAN